MNAEAQTTQPAVAAAGRERLSLDRGWLFKHGDIPFPVINGHQQSYNNAKAGTASGAASANFDDSAWRQLDLPHDWAVEAPFDAKANISQGYRPRGMGWYRRYFKLDPADRGKHLEIQFDGVSTHCTVWVNGIVAHRNWSGYSSFQIDITPFARYGNDNNVIAVRVDAEAQEGWWYEGAGIYRHTWLVKRPAVHIATDGVYANPVRDADGKWLIPIEVTLNNAGKTETPLEVTSTLIDPDGKNVAEVSAQVRSSPLQTSVAKMSMPVTSPRLWSVDEPTLYQVRTTVSQGGAVSDEVVTRCGFRTIRFDADKGFFLNDQPLKLKGTCNHQDHAGVGVAVPDALWEFRLRKLKEMGSNAYRCAHNPPAAEFLDACDRMGMLVMDETRHFNTTPEYIRQLEWLVMRDRNHPSVILWSVFNEEPSQGTEMGYEMVRRMSAVVKRLDITRPVTAAQNSAMLNTINASLAADVAGFNYRHGEYDRYHTANPTKPITSSEDTSAVMTRGEYVTDKSKPVLDSYDTQFQSWGATHRAAWKRIAERPFLAGGFVWTGFDYRGEPQPLQWPATGSSFGIMDLCGFPKSAFYIHQAQWIEDRPILQLIPHWNWAGKEGQPVKVMALTNVDAVELTLNGKVIGEKPVDKFDMVSWDVPYEAGKLEAVGKKAGREVSRFVVETTGAPAAIQLVPDRKALAGDGHDAQPVTVQIVDAQGRAVPTANHMVNFEIAGPAAIIGLNNGDPNCHEPEKGNQHSLFNGLAQVIVQAQTGTGPATLRASSDGLTAAELVIDVGAASRPEVPAVRPPQVIVGWRMSPTAKERPDPNQKIGDTDMNTWSSIQPGGRLQPLVDGTFAVFRAQFTPRIPVQKAGGKVVLRNVTGKAQVWLDGKMVGEKANAERGNMTVSLEPGDTERTISVLIEAAAGAPAGLGGNVTVE
ncbi:MAG: glycoside hydrolase family 2 protein [Burkholderiales bacterium]|nr:glycoside hydrolase family 2 protein [Phycisphaerae bacterium]